MRKFINTLTCLCVIAACGTVFAQKSEKMMSGPYTGPRGPITAEEAPAAAPFYSNLVVDPCTGDKYDLNNGFLVIGPSNCFLPGSTQWLAEPFIAGHTGTVAKVQLSVTLDSALCTSATNKFTVAIYSDNSPCNGLPNAQIGTAVTATAPAAPPALANANFSTAGVSLTQGVKYWVVVTTSTASTQMSTTAVWWEATNSIEPFNTGTGWNTGFLGGPGGFIVQ